jgi:hypothetical protein
VTCYFWDIIIWIFVLFSQLDILIFRLIIKHQREFSTILTWNCFETYRRMISNKVNLSQRCKNLRSRSGVQTLDHWSWFVFERMRKMWWDTQCRFNKICKQRAGKLIQIWIDVITKAGFSARQRQRWAIFSSRPQLHAIMCARLKECVFVVCTLLCACVCTREYAYAHTYSHTAHIESFCLTKHLPQPPRYYNNKMQAGIV